MSEKSTSLRSEDVAGMEARIARVFGGVVRDPLTKNQVRRKAHAERFPGGFAAFDAAWSLMLEQLVVMSADTAAYRAKIGRRYWLAPEWMHQENQPPNNAKAGAKDCPEV